jgi:hypothetical protein
MKMMQGCVLLALLEQIAHAAGADAHEHLDEVRTRNGIERNASLARDGARKQRLARSRRPHHEHALGNATAEARELLRILEEGDDLLDLVLGLLDAGDIGEGHLLLVLGQQLGLRLAEAHGLAAAHLKLAHEEQEHDRDHQNRQPGDEDLLPEPALALAHDLVRDAGLVQLLQGLLPDEARGHEGLVVLLQGPAELGVVAVHPDLQRRRWLEVARRLLDLLDEFRERQGLLDLPWVDELPDDDEGEDHHHPDQYGFVAVAHPVSLRGGCTQDIDTKRGSVNATHGSRSTLASSRRDVPIATAAGPERTRMAPEASQSTGRSALSCLGILASMSRSESLRVPRPPRGAMRSPGRGERTRSGHATFAVEAGAHFRQGHAHAAGAISRPGAGDSKIR